MFGKSLVYVVKVEGMMCQHCAKQVEDALSKLSGVKSVKVDLSGKKATVKCKEEIPEAAFKTAIEEAGYQFVGLE